MQVLLSIGDSQMFSASSPPDFFILFEQATSETEGKIQALVDLGFDRAAAENALLLCNGNQDQAASYLFGGYD